MLFEYADYARRIADLRERAVRSAERAKISLRPRMLQRKVPAGLCRAVQRRQVLNHQGAYRNVGYQDRRRHHD